MATGSTIEWTEATWNPLTGCSKVSTGCKHCYAERMSKRLNAMGSTNYRNGFQLTVHEHMLIRPLTWKKPRLIFVNSMSDLFHVDAPEEFIQRTFEVMNQAHWHRFQVLTKRPERLAELSSSLSWSSNIWMGVSVETQRYTSRIDLLRESGAAIKFLSLEPLLGPLEGLDLRGINWVITGGESGPKARPVNADWVRSIRDQSVSAAVPFFFKQWGGVHKKQSGNILDGRTWLEMP